MSTVVFRCVLLTIQIMSLHSTPLVAPFGSSEPPFSQQILREIEHDKQLLDRIRKERLKAQELKEGLQKKEAELTRISYENKELTKLKPYFEKFNEMKRMLDEALLTVKARDNENEKLNIELERLATDFEVMQGKVTDSDRSRICLMKERSELERLNREIQHTFIEYKNECRSKETDLMGRLERMYRHSKDEKRLIEQLDDTRKELSSYKRRIQQLQDMRKSLEDQKAILAEALSLKEKEMVSLRHNQNSNTMNSKYDDIDKYQLMMENEELKRGLMDKEKELQKSRMFNHELSIQYDSSVNKNLQFERQLYEYRRENHELKKQVSLFIEKDDYDRVYKKELMLDRSLDDSQSLDNLTSKNI